MEKSSFFILVLGLVAIHSAEAGPDFKCLGATSKCFAVITPGDNGIAQKAAKEACHEMGAGLASIHSSAENDFVYGLTKQADPGNNYAYWIGMELHVHSETGVIYSASWSDATATDYGDPSKITPGTKPWMQGEPNNQKNMGQDEACVNLNPTGWNDEECGQQRSGYTFGYVCQKPGK